MVDVCPSHEFSADRESAQIAQVLARLSLEARGRVPLLSSEQESEIAGRLFAEAEMAQKERANESRRWSAAQHELGEMTR